MSSFRYKEITLIENFETHKIDKIVMYEILGELRKDILKHIKYHMIKMNYKDNRWRNMSENMIQEIQKK